MSLFDVPWYTLMPFDSLSLCRIPSLVMSTCRCLLFHFSASRRRLFMFLVSYSYLMYLHSEPTSAARILYILLSVLICLDRRASVAAKQSAISQFQVFLKYCAFPFGHLTILRWFLISTYIFPLRKWRFRYDIS
jgi:hypothetical protein